jgi:hypothetical protein
VAEKTIEARVVKTLTDSYAAWTSLFMLMLSLLTCRVDELLEGWLEVPLRPVQQTWRYHLLQLQLLMPCCVQRMSKLAISLELKRPSL